jgi:hypothetical protein
MFTEETPFAKKPEYDEYLDKFFELHPYPAVSWMHDLHKGRFVSAADSLLLESKKAADVAAKEVSACL